MASKTKVSIWFAFLYPLVLDVLHGDPFLEAETTLNRCLSRQELLSGLPFKCCSGPRLLILGIKMGTCSFNMARPLKLRFHIWAVVVFDKEVTSDLKEPQFKSLHHKNNP